jgi:uncharacterized membrane protein
MFPQLPSWDGMHPLVVHFPIALILVAPIFVILSMILRKSARPLAVCALVLMALGTIGAMAAVSTGEAGAEVAERTPGAEQAVEEHEELAETTRTMLIIVTVVYGLIVLAPMVYKKALEPIPSIALNGSFLILYLVAASYLANTAHQGGVLVHTYGVHATLGAPATLAANGGEASNDEDDD